ncbi:MAG: HNH endonuclease [Chitinophagales bacterium]
MIPIEKDFEAIPKIIYYKPRLDAFEKNKTAGKYCSSDNLYKPNKVKIALDAIYHRKCAYCEKSLKDTDRHVEHYRPKAPYFWLAFSWDNLLIACKKCNELKSNQFTDFLEGNQLQYNNETLQTAQSQIEAYNLTEKPLILNPEQETETSLKGHFTFDLTNKKNQAKLIPKSKQMEVTIEVCQLNRKELVELRAYELTRLRNHLRQDLNSWKGEHQKAQRAQAIGSTIIKFKQEISPEISFVAWRKFIVQNWRFIVDNLI